MLVLRARDVATAARSPARSPRQARQPEGIGVALMTDLTISDHALVRYIERVKSFDLEFYREEIRTLVRRHVGQPAPAGAAYDDGLVFVVERLSAAPTVVTVLAPGFRSKRHSFGRTLVRVPLTAVPEAAS